MRFNTTITILFCLIFIALGSKSSFAQNDRQEEEKLIDKLWFGGNIGLGFNNSQNFRQFFIGLAPMVGYKITDAWSIGPRIDLSYTHIRLETPGRGVEKVNDFNVGAAVFTRYKVFTNFFAHVETGIINIPSLVRDQAGNLITVDERRQTMLIGLGYTAGGGEIVLLYDLNAPDDSVELPIDFRFGFNYNF